VKRGPLVRPQASEGEAQHGPFCWTGRIGQGDRGKIVREVKVASEPEALLAVLKNPARGIAQMMRAGFIARFM